MISYSNILHRKKNQKYLFDFLMSKNDLESTNFANFEEVVHNFGRSDDDNNYLVKKMLIFNIIYYIQTWIDAQLIKKSWMVSSALCFIITFRQLQEKIELAVLLFFRRDGPTTWTMSKEKGRRKIWKSGEGGASSNLVGIICPHPLICQNLRGPCPPPAPTALEKNLCASIFSTLCSKAVWQCMASREIRKSMEIYQRHSNNQGNLSIIRFVHIKAKLI